MPRPINPPAIPPTAAPTAAPLNAAIIGPAAMKGPTPGMANAPIPAIHPNAPPMTPPVPAPATAPSGRFTAASLILLNKTHIRLLAGSRTFWQRTELRFVSRHILLQSAQEPFRVRGVHDDAGNELPLRYRRIHVNEV